MVAEGTVIALDRDDSTGIWVSDDALFRNVITRTHESTLMQLQSFSCSSGKRMLVEDKNFDFHDVLLHKSRLYLVSTGTNEVVALSAQGQELERYSYPGGTDSWHINCLGVWDAKVVLSAFGEFDSLRGYKHGSRNRGFVIELESNKKLWEGLSQPHTPAQRDGKYYICNSEERQVLIKGQDSNVLCLQFDGYTRGIAFSDHFMYVGLSKSRNIPAEAANSPFARIVALDLDTREICGEVSVAFAEIYDIRIARNPLLPIIMLSLNGREHALELSMLRERAQQLNRLRAQFQRVNSNAVSGPVLRLIRWARRDASFGNPDDC